MELLLTNKAQKRLEKALEIAKERTHSLIFPEHILLAITKDLPTNFENQQKITVEANKRLSTIALTQAEPTHSPQFVELIQKAQSIRKSFEDRYISVTHIILALTQVSMNVPTFNLLKSEIETELRKSKKPVDTAQSDADNADLPSFATEMVQQAREGRFDPVTGRENEIRSLIEILSKKTKSNPILVGNPGVGKTAIVSAIASMIANDELPTLRNYKIYNVDIASILAGTGVRGEFEERLKKIIKEATKDPKTVLFIDEIHMAISAGSTGSGSVDAANILKPALAAGDIKCIGATTFYEYRKYIEKDPAFARRFVRVPVGQPGISDSVTMLRGLRQRIEAFHGTRINDSAIVAAVRMAKKYVPGRMLPDSAIDLLDTACAAAVISVETESPEALKTKSRLWSLGLEKASLELDLKRRKEGKASHADISSIEQQLNDVSRRIADAQEELIPLEQAHAQKKILLDQRKQLQQRIDEYTLKYNEAVRANDTLTAADIMNFILPSLKEELQKLKQSEITEITPQHIEEVVSRWTGIPVARLALGESDRLLALHDRLRAKIFGQEEAVNIVADAIITARSGLNDPNKPIGCFLFLGPTGVGKTELAKALCYEMFDTENGVVIDMSDYSSEMSVTKLIGVSAGYVGYDEGGRLTEPVKNKPYNLILFDEVDLAHPSVFNILYQLIDEGRVVDGKGVEVDFTNTIVILTSNLGYKHITNNHRVNQKIHAEQAAIAKFGPALFNRIDAVIHFNSLEPEMINEILDKQLVLINERMKEHNMLLKIDDCARAEILRNAVSDQFGARPLKKYLQRHIVNPIARFVLKKDKDSKESEIITVNCEKRGVQSGCFFFERNIVQL